MKKSLLLLFFLSATGLFGNINAIHLEKWSKNKIYKSKIDFIIFNKQYYENWTSEWNFDISRDSLVKNLKDCEKTFKNIKDNSVELRLLLGDISHYLYNLNEQEYFAIAENYYKDAIKSAPKDYRGYWFIGTHYGLSAKPELSMQNFFAAEKILPSNCPADFWEEYAYAAMIANMNAHAIYAMDHSRAIKGSPGSFEQQVGPIMKSKMLPVYKDSAYTFLQLWDGEKKDFATLISKPLGIKMLLDTVWDVNLNDFNNGITAVTLSPQKIKGKNNQEISYSIAMIIKVAEPGQSVEDFVSQVSSAYKQKKKIDFKINRTPTSAYEIMIDTLYKENGGAHLHVVGIEKNKPSYPGLILENPVNFTSTNLNPEEVSYFTPVNTHTRFNEKLMYIFILDTSEDIHDKSFAVFKDFILNKLIIE